MRSGLIFLLMLTSLVSCSISKSRVEHLKDEVTRLQELKNTNTTEKVKYIEVPIPRKIEES
jgi:hypothetical protein